MESWSTWNATSARNAPAAIHVKRSSVTVLAPGGSPASWTNPRQATTNPAPTAAHPTAAATASLCSLLPTSPLNRNPMKGRRTA